MTRAFGDRIFEDENGDIGEHLRNHIHLTNCIHVKNHIHKHSPMLSDRALIRDLIVLQRSRSLRDPSASPPSWHSHPVIDMLGNRNAIEEGRRSLGIERSSRVFGTGGSAALGNFATSKVVPGEVNVFSNGIVASSERINKTGVRDGRRRVGRDDSSRRSSGTNVLGLKDEPLQNEDGNAFVLKAVSGNSESKVSNTKAGNLTLSQQLNDLPMDSDDVASSNVRPWRRHSGLGKMGDEAEVSIHGHSKVLNRAKWRKHRTARRTRASTTSKVRDQTEFSMALNSFAHGSTHQKQQTQENEDEYKEQNVTRAPKNGCGIPWNWSRIHHSGKTFLDMAGRSLSCGLSDSRLRRGAAGSHGRGVHAMPVASDYSSCSTKSDAQALPLLVDASISPGTAENGTWVNDYSGELGIYVENLLRNNIDSDLASEDRSSGCRKLGSSHNVGHQNLTHKYMPKTFKDLVGQNLVAQALSNAVMKRKVGVLYVFYGPHGTGKTSCARIFARSLNCRSPGHPKPCGYCNSCVAHDLGKSRNTREVGPVSNIDFKGIMDVIDKSILSEVTSQYRVVIFDDCDTLPPDCWNAILKIIDKAPRRVVFILVCSSLDVLPHMIISRCQKFFFPKLRDADIVYTLQWISSKEDVEIDDDALKLIASRSDGSLRDAEMTLEQLSLLGQKISVPLVQELVGLISDEKLVDLLDLALSADTVNTVKSLRVIMETGVEPLALMSQLATIVTDILAGSYDFTKERNKRKFFRQQPLAKEDMEKLRQALKTLSEAEKQLRMSNDKLTWLTAALLQLAPDQQYMVPISAAETVYHSPEAPNDAAGRYLDRREGELVVVPNGSAGFSRNGTSMDRKRHAGTSGLLEGQNLKLHSDIIPITAKQSLQRNGVEDIWLEVLEKIQNSSLKEFLSKEGKLISVSFGAAPTAYLMFSSPMTKSKAEKFRGHILQAFEAALNSPVTIEIRCGAQKDARMQRVGYDSGRRNCNIQDNGAGSQAEFLHLKSLEVGRNEIVEVLASPRKAKDDEHANNTAASTWDVNMGSTSGRRTGGEESQTQSVVRSRMSLAHVIQHSEGSTMKNGRSKHKAVSIAEKLEQENLRLEPRSRSLLCWKASRMTRRKLSRLKIGKRRPCSLLKVVSCGRCLNSKSPR